MHVSSREQKRQRAEEIKSDSGTCNHVRRYLYFRTDRPQDLNCSSGPVGAALCWGVAQVSQGASLSRPVLPTTELLGSFGIKGCRVEGSRVLAFGLWGLSVLGFGFRGSGSHCGSFRTLALFFPGCLLLSCSSPQPP